jgi:hypothetical protein
MTTRDSGVIRVDTVQHQTHALLLALDTLYPDPKGSTPADAGPQRRARQGAGK